VAEDYQLLALGTYPGCLCLIAENGSGNSLKKSMVKFELGFSSSGLEGGLNGVYPGFFYYK